MKTRNLALVLFLLIPLLTICQSKYEKGYIIKEDGKKIEGYIKYGLNKSLCREVTFLTKNKAQKTIYTPTEVKEFKFENLNRLFKHIRLPIANVTNTNDTLWDVFAEILVKTPTRTLFLYKPDDSKRRLFIQTPEIAIKELISEEKTTKVDGSNFVYSKKTYIGILKNCFKNDQQIHRKIDNLPFTTRAIARLFIESSTTLNEEVLHESSVLKDNGNLQIVVGVGVSYVSSKVISYSRSKWWKSLETPQPLAGIPFGLSFFYYPPNIRNTFFMGFGSSYSLKGAYSDVSKTSFRQDYLNFNLSLGYHYPFGKVKPYWGAEVTQGVLLNPNNAFTSTAPTNSGASLVLSPVDYKKYTRELGFGFFLGIDIPFSFYGIRAELKYHYGYLPGLYNFVILQQHSLQLQIQFRLSTAKKQRK